MSLPAIEFLTEKTITGSYYGSGDVHDARSPSSTRLVVDGRLDLAEVVSDLIGLDDVEAALERLRRGQGARSVIVIDEELAAERRDEPRRPRRADRRGVGRRPGPTAATSTSCSAAAGRQPPRRCSDVHVARARAHADPRRGRRGSGRSYEPVWPPTIMINKATANEDLHESMTWGGGAAGHRPGRARRGRRRAARADRRRARVRVRWVDPARPMRRRSRVPTARPSARRSASASTGAIPTAARALVERRDDVTSPFYTGDSTPRRCDR